MATDCFQYLSVERHGRVLLVTLGAKEIYQEHVADVIRQELSSAFRSEDIRDVIIDMRSVEFISSVGYGPLITLRREVMENGGWLVVCELSSFVHQVFIETRLLIEESCNGAMFHYAPSVKRAFELLADRDRDLEETA
jgi:anti-anti-sigma factor